MKRRQIEIHTSVIIIVHFIFYKTTSTITSHQKYPSVIGVLLLQAKNYFVVSLICAATSPSRVLTLYGYVNDDTVLADIDTKTTTILIKKTNTKLISFFCF